jgi:hypothetical protein
MYLTYRAEDFILYTFSLVLFGIIAIAAIHSTWQLIVIYLSLIYLFIFFIFKTGIKIDLSSLYLIVKESIKYPIVFWKELYDSLLILSPVFLSFFFALLVENIFSSKLNSTFWLQPFPFLIFFYINFIGLTLFRTVILLAHLKKYAFIQSFLTASPWSSQLKNVHIIYHIIQSYIIGVLGHLGLFFGPLIFWYLTTPTYIREFALLIFYVIFQIIYFWIYYSKKGFTKFNYPVNFDSYAKWYEINHTRGHASRFYFTVFHGTHHDTIPSGLLATTGTGLIESIHRSLVRLHFLQSASLFLTVKTIPTIFMDVVAHQYIPGVFPYAKTGVKVKSHHSIHHYLSLLPLSISALPYIQTDIDNGYDLANPKAKWFAQAVVKYENIATSIADNYIQPYEEEQIEGIPLEYGENRIGMLDIRNPLVAKFCVGAIGVLGYN